MTSKNHYSQRKRLSVIAGVVAGGLLGFGAMGEPRADDENEIEIEGTVSELSGTCPELKFTVNQVTVITNKDTDFDDMACSEIRDGRRVQVEARSPRGEGEGDPLEQPLLAEEIELQ